MKGYWNQLRPLEKRLVVGIGAVVFIILNAWFVVPHFSDLKKVQTRRENAEAKLRKYETEVARLPALTNEIRKFEREGTDVPQEDQAGHFASTITSQAASHQVETIQTFRIQATTNQNFFEFSQGISVQSKEQELVTFLYDLGAGNSLIRVRDLTLHTDQPRQKLAANITFVASYQRKMPTRSTSASQPTSAKSVAPATKSSTPAAQPAKQPAPAGAKAATNTVRPGPATDKAGFTNRPPNLKKK